MCECGVPGGALNLNSTGYLDHGRYGDLRLQGKIPMVEPGIEPETSWLVVRSSDHQVTNMVTAINIKACIQNQKNENTALYYLNYTNMPE
jgi:hypothetical protein